MSRNTGTKKITSTDEIVGLSDFNKFSQVDWMEIEIIYKSKVNARNERTLQFQKVSEVKLPTENI